MKHPTGRVNTCFLAIVDGKLTVQMVYTQGERQIGLKMAEAIEVKPGLFMRRNFAAGQGRFPKTYASAYAALVGMVKPREQRLFAEAQVA